MTPETPNRAVFRLTPQEVVDKLKSAWDDEVYLFWPVSPPSGPDEKHCFYEKLKQVLEDRHE